VAAHRAGATAAHLGAGGRRFESSRLDRKSSACRRAIRLVPEFEPGFRGCHEGTSKNPGVSYKRSSTTDPDAPFGFKPACRIPILAINIANSMQLQLQLATFEYQNKLKVRTATINGDPWFYGSDVCKVLDIASPSSAYGRLEKDDLRTIDGIDALGRRQQNYVVSEYGLYDLIFHSRKEEAKRFKRWVTHEVLPQLRRTGSFGIKASSTPAFVRRFNDNWDRVERGYFSVISELFIRVYGRFEQIGHVLADSGPDGKEIRPDVSVGKAFPKWLAARHPEFKGKRKRYNHRLSDGTEVEAWQYEVGALPAFIEFVEQVWLPEYAPNYLEKRDVNALQYLPKLLPSFKRT
jgi:prophage antirepressor-like protein